MSEFKSCPVCQEESEQCLTCASYVVDGERIYYEKLKDFGATQDYELRFIQRIQKHRTTAFFHKGKLYIPSRQGRSVPLAIGLQWEAWQEQQAKLEELQKQLNEYMFVAETIDEMYVKEVQKSDELQKRVEWLEDRLKATDTLSKMRAAVIGSFNSQEFNARTRRKMMILKRAEQALKGEGQ
ncbi:hypothetical protein VXR12_11305 [Acinetobacter baumannii]